MKLASVILSIFFLSAIINAQDSAILKNFEKNKSSYSLTKFAMGEDASSGWNYLVYRQKTSTKKIRAIWSNYSEITVEDYFYENGKPLLHVKYSAQKSRYNSLVKGSNLSLKVIETSYFSNSKLTKWVENGKSVPQSDPRWLEIEKDLITGFNDQLDLYRDYLKGEL